MNSLRNLFSDDKKQSYNGIGKLMKPTEAEQARFGLNSDPIALQYFEGQCRGKAFDTFEFLGLWRYSNEETQKEMLQYPSFWRTLQYLAKPDSRYYHNPMDFVWKLIKDQHIQPPLHTLTSEEIQRVIAAQNIEGMNQNQESLDFGKSWLERWMLTQNTHITTEESSAPRVSKSRL